MLYNALPQVIPNSGHIFVYNKSSIFLKGKHFLCICILPCTNNIFLF